MSSWRDWLPGQARETRFGVIGLDFGPEGLHLVQLREEEGRSVLHAGCSVPYPVERAELGRLPRRALRNFFATALKAGGFAGRRVVLPAPRERVKLHVTNYELPEGRSEAEVILGMVRERYGPEAAGSVVDFVPMRTAGGQKGEQSALVAVANQQEITRDLRFLAETGLEIEAIEVAPLAIHRLVAWGARQNLAQDVLVIHCGAEKSDLTVLWGRRLILYREIDFGESMLVEALSRALDVSNSEAAAMLHEHGLPSDSDEKPEDGDRIGEIRSTLLEILRPSFTALAEQVDRALVYTASRSHGSVVEHVHLSGRLANWPGADQLLDDLLSIPVSVLDARQILATEGSPPPECGVGIALAAGCSLRGISSHG